MCRVREANFSLFRIFSSSEIFSLFFFFFLAIDGQRQVRLGFLLYMLRIIFSISLEGCGVQETLNSAAVK